MFGEFGVGFFAEAFDLEGWVLGAGIGDGGAGAAFDVAVGGAWPGGADADGDEAVGVFGEGEGVCHDGLVGGGVLDELVGGEDHHDGVGVAGGNESDAEGNGGCGIAFGGLGEDIFGGEFFGDGADGIELEGVGEDEDVFRGDEAFEAVDGLFEECSGAEEVEELFGFVVATEGPEAGAGSTGENEGVGVLGSWHGGRRVAVCGGGESGNMEILRGVPWCLRVGGGAGYFFGTV